MITHIKSSPLLNLESPFFMHFIWAVNPIEFLHYYPDEYNPYHYNYGD
jgi:hypothetical protein